MASWKQSFALFAQKRIFLLFMLGISSGLPLAMTSSTLGFWLTEASINIKLIGAIALVGIFYNFKFIWSPLVDVVKIPLLDKKLGRRRSWMLVTQIGLALSILGISLTDPASALLPTIGFALAIAFFSATQDIVIDAYRIEILGEDEQAAASAIYVYGYRAGMFISGAVALKLSEYLSWNGVYIFLAATISIGIIATLLGKEPAQLKKQNLRGLAAQIKHAVISPFADFMQRRGWLLMLVFVVAYKFPAAFLGGGLMSSFYLKMGFEKDQIFFIVKTVGLFATLAGLFIGGLLAVKLGLIRALWIDAILQAITNLLFIPIVQEQGNIHLLGLAVCAENVASSMGTVVLVAFISKLCNKEFSATQYALLSSLAAAGRTLLAANGGVLVEHLGWEEFFFITFLSGIPALIMLPFVAKYMGAKKVDSPPQKP